MSQIDISKAKCTGLSFEAAVNLAQQGDGELTGFELDGYTGAVVQRWWGKLAICLDGISCKQKMPIFKDHNQTQIVGYSTSTTNTPTFKVSGVFSKTTAAAKEVMALASEGFPWQASIGVMPKAITELKQGATMTVNGEELAGPAEIWTQSEVFETSFVPLGADGNTSATVFSKIQEIEERAIEPTNREESMNLEKLKTDHPELVAEIVQGANAGHEEALAAAREEGAKLERERIKSVKEQEIPGFEDVVELAMFDGKSTAGDVAIAINQKHKESLQQHSAYNSADAPAPVAEPANDMKLNADTGPVTKEKLQKKWDKDPALQAEFGGDFESYLALEMPGDGVIFKNHGKGE